MYRRIQYAKAHDTLLADLVHSSDNSAPFETKAKCLVFAAAFGASFGPEKGRMALSDRKGEPIRYDVFAGQEFEDLICSLAVFATNDIAVLENSDERADQRVTIFEEFANYGLHRLEAELKGVADKTAGIALIMTANSPGTTRVDGIDWSKIESL